VLVAGDVLHLQHRVQQLLGYSGTQTLCTSSTQVSDALCTVLIKLRAVLPGVDACNMKRRAHVTCLHCLTVALKTGDAAPIMGKIKLPVV